MINMDLLLYRVDGYINAYAMRITLDLLGTAIPAGRI